MNNKTRSAEAAARACMDEAFNAYQQGIEDSSPELIAEAVGDMLAYTCPYEPEGGVTVNLDGDQRYYFIRNSELAAELIKLHPNEHIAYQTSQYLEDVIGRELDAEELEEELTL